MRNFVMSDMHGHATAARALLNYAEVDMSKDRLRFLGDYIDRGPNSLECMRLVQKYQRQGAVAHMGNHEMMLMMWVAQEIDTQTFYVNGGEATLNSIYKGIEGQDEFDQILYWISQLKITDEDDEYFYVHAGIHPHISLTNQSTEHFLWIRDEFLMARGEHLLQATNGKTIVHGHTPMEAVCFDGVKINTDLGAGGRKKLALVELTEQKVYIYDFEQARLNGKDFAISVVPIEEASPVSLYK